jgi:hypothetical protein
LGHTPTGSEHGPGFPGNPQEAIEGGAKSGEVLADFFSIDDPYLAQIVATWPTLPEPIRCALLALVETALPVAPAVPGRPPDDHGATFAYPARHTDATSSEGQRDLPFIGLLE